MREMLDQWDFVVGAYGVTVLALSALLGWSWATMRGRERRREALRDSARRGDR